MKTRNIQFAMRLHRKQGKQALKVEESIYSLSGLRCPLNNVPPLTKPIINFWRLKGTKSKARSPLAVDLRQRVTFDTYAFWDFIRWWLTKVIKGWVEKGII